jgi:hypothetical protein
MSSQYAGWMLAFDAPAATLKAVAETVRDLRALGNATDNRFWFDQKEQLGDLFEAVLSCFLGEYRLFGREFPEFDPGNAATATVARPGSRLVVLSQRPDGFERAREALLGQGFESKLVAQTRRRVGDSSFAVVVLEIASPAGSPLEAVFDLPGDEGRLVAGSSSSRLPLRRFEANHATALEASPESVRASSASATWSYTVDYSRLRVPDSGRYLFTLDYRLFEGKIGFIAVGVDGETILGLATPVRTSEGRRRESIQIDLEAGQAIWLVVRNETADDQPASFALDGLRAYRILP